MSAVSVIMLGASKSHLQAQAKFTFEQEVRLAHEVAKRPILWDARQKIYKRSDLKDQVWEEVATCIGFQFSSNDGSTRFKTIKDTFMKNWRKVLESKSKCSDAGETDIYKSIWGLYTSFLFLKKIYVHAASTSNIPVSVILECNEQLGSSLSPTTDLELAPLEKDLAAAETHYIDNNVQFEDSNLWELRSSPTSPNLLVPSRPVSTSTPISKRPAQEEVAQLYCKRGQTKRTNAYLMEEAVNVMRDISKQPTAPPLAAPSPDHEEIFASFIASRLRNMDAEMKKECENAILSVLLQY